MLSVQDTVTLFVRFMLKLELSESNELGPVTRLETSLVTSVQFPSRSAISVCKDKYFMLQDDLLSVMFQVRELDAPVHSQFTTVPGQIVGVNV